MQLIYNNKKQLTEKQAAALGKRKTYWRQL